jgi:2-polyprenyl-6-methoxyphenol hydroxylase-like FAD-dependent oxidoreductase
MHEPAAIVVGGIGGMTAALAFLQRGIHVEVYEQAPELREIGAGEAEKYVAQEWREERVKQRFDSLFVYDALAVPV